MSSSNQDEFGSPSSSPSTTPRTSPMLFSRHHSLTSERENGSGSAYNVSTEQRSMTQPSSTTNRFQQLQIHTDISVRAPHAINSPRETLAEEELIDRLKEIISAFMTRPDRRYSYDTTMRWTVYNGNEINYTVVIHINQHSNSF